MPLINIQSFPYEQLNAQHRQQAVQSKPNIIDKFGYIKGSGARDPIGADGLARSSEDKGSFRFWDIPEQQFNQSFGRLSATGAVSLPANGDWSLSVEVAADIPIPSGSMYGGGNGTFFTGSRILLNAPPATGGVNASSDDAWQTCVTFWDLIVDEYPDELREDDGSCSSGLSPDCIGAIEREIVDDSSPQSGCTCPQLDKIDSCANSTDMNSWPNGQLEVRRYGGPLHDSPNDLTSYNETGSIAWPVAVVRSEPRPGNTSRIDRTTAKLSCVRANKAAEGGSVPGKPSTGGGISSGRTPGVWASFSY
ncbi:uncharacterized protein PG986_002393 [Apiospora aurea]|uniref:Uncharacterized protein n=1 Tax=Apiospora aurea TaxID=335848 RepID=A0ABR1QNP7_9PEZI